MIRLSKKTVILLFVFMLPVWLQAAPTRDELKTPLSEYLLQQYSTLSSSPLPSGVFYDLVLPISKIEEVAGSEYTPVLSSKRLLQIAFEMQRASIAESPFPPHMELRKQGNEFAKTGIYPIVFVDYRYDRLKQGIDADQVIGYEKDQVVSFDAETIESQRVFAASTLREWTYRGKEVRFRIDRKQFYFTNLESPKSLEIDFDDGAGFREIKSEFEDVIAHYETTGMKTIRVRAKQSDGIELRGAFRFEVRSLDAPLPTETWQVQAQIPYQGVYAAGEAYVYLSDQHSTLTNPVILAEGLDLGNVLNWDELYEIMNTQNLLEDLRTMGYDAVVLNYTESTTYIQANGYLVVELLNEINAIVPEGTSSALVGSSMGGLTTRFALDYLESNSIPHNVRTWISFDAPHAGADIPLGIQYWADFFASQSEDAAAARDGLNSPAAKQLLVAHFTSPPSSAAAPDAMRAAFMTELNNLGGYPDLPRKVAVANGSGSMQGVGFNPGAQIILWQYRSFFVDIDGNCWALNNTQNQTIFDGEINLIWPLPDENRTVTVQPTWPWDNAPGGLSATMQELADVTAPYGDIVALYPSHCFIPTISSLDLSVADPFYDIVGNANLLDLSPFDTLYYPVENQDHITITAENYWWFLREIIETLPAPEIVVSVANDSVRLNWPAIPGARSYQVFESGNPEQWPPAFGVTSQTNWVVPLGNDEMRFYRVAASIEAGP